MAEFKDLTPNAQKAADACIKQGLKDIETTSNTKESTGNSFFDKALEIGAVVSGNSNDYDVAMKSRNITAATKKSATLKDDCINEVYANQQAGKTPLWEPPAKKTSEASSDKGTVAETKPQSGELSDFAKGVSKFVSGVVSMFGSKDGNPEPIISSSSDTMIGRMLVNKHNTPSPQVQQDLPPVPKTAAKGRL